MMILNNDDLSLYDNFECFWHNHCSDMDGNVALAIYRDQYNVPNEYIERIKEILIAERTSGGKQWFLIPQ